MSASDFPLSDYEEIGIAADAVYYCINRLLDVLRNHLPYEDEAEDLFWKNDTLWKLRQFVERKADL